MLGHINAEMVMFAKVTTLGYDPNVVNLAST